MYINSSSMKVIDINNYKAMKDCAKINGWCYSTDGKQIQVASTLYQKIYVYIFGNESLLNKAVIGSFARTDQDLINTHLKDVNFIKNNLSMLPPLRHAVLNGIPANKEEINALTDRHMREQSSVLEALTRTHRIFFDIHNLKNHMSQHQQEYNEIIHNEAKNIFGIEFRNLIDNPKFLMQLPGLPQTPSYRRKFYLEERPYLAAILDIMKDFNSIKEISRLPLESKDFEEKLHYINQYLVKINNISKEIDSYYDTLPYPNSRLSIFEEIIQEECTRLKEKFINEALLSSFSRYQQATLGAIYENSFRTTCVLSASFLSIDDLKLLLGCLSKITLSDMVQIG